MSEFERLKVALTEVLWAYDNDSTKLEADDEMWERARAALCPEPSQPMDLKRIIETLVMLDYTPSEVRNMTIREASALVSDLLSGFRDRCAGSVAVDNPE